MEKSVLSSHEEITEEQYLAAQLTIRQYREQLKKIRAERSVKIGDLVRANCTAPARAIGNGNCVCISSVGGKQLFIDIIDMEAEWSNPSNLPLPSDEDLKKYL